jgi:hypothetical protein
MTPLQSNNICYVCASSCPCSVYCDGGIVPLLESIPIPTTLCHTSTTHIFYSCNAPTTWATTPLMNKALDSAHLGVEHSWLPTQGEFCQWTYKAFQSCILVFTVDPRFLANVTTLQGNHRSSGFLPSGLFERIISKLSLWCQTTSRYSTFSHRNNVAHRNLAILHFGNQRFRLVACPLVNSIRVDIQGEIVIKTLPSE